MDHPDRVQRFLQRVDRSLDQFLIEDREAKTQTVKPSCFLSKAQIDEHYDVHYKGYLKGLQQARARLEVSSQKDSSHNGSDFRSALFDIAFNYNGALLHEIYFECLGAQKMPSELTKTLNKSFGTEDKMKRLLRATLMGSKGWAIMGYDERDEKFCISLIDSHDCSVPYWRPVLALDVWEHAYYIDFKSDKEKYVDGMLEDINWEAVAKRVDKVLS